MKKQNKTSVIISEEKDKKISTLSKSTIVTVALAADNNYAMPMGVTMTSILENAQKTTSYEFYLLVPSDFSQENKDKIIQLKNKYPCKINFIDMKNAFDDSPNSLKHTTNQSYYRLLLSQILPDLEKIIYLDVDTVVLEDLAELYNTDLGDSYYAGVFHPTYYFGNWEGHCKLLNISDLHSYINAGVLLINLDQIRKDNLVPRLLEGIEKNYPAIDQDVINSICYERIKKLPFKYNVLIKTVNMLRDNNISQIYGYQEFFDAFKFPAIVHFANPIKPWQDSSLLFADKWTKFFNISPYKDANLDITTDHTDQVPEISVVMATHNRQDFLDESIKSILEQSFSNFEFIIVDDASTDNTPFILNYYQTIDKRIKVIKNNIQKGISYSRNVAFDVSRGKYIAVMDDDDIALSNRFQVEYDYLLNHKKIVVVASNIEVFQTGSATNNNTSFWKDSWTRELSSSQLPIMMMLRNYICHSSTLMRKDFLLSKKIRYNEEITCCVDYDLWVNIILNNGEISILNNILQKYRVHPHSITTTKSTRLVQDKLVDELRIKLLEKFFDSRKDAELYFKIFKNLSEIDKLKQIKELNTVKKIFADIDINQCIAVIEEIPYPSYTENLIPIVFASDNNYAPYLSVLMKSIISQANSKYNYEFLVLETKISKLNKDLIFEDMKEYPNLSIKFINPKIAIGETKFFCPNYYTEETYYRLFMQTIFRFYTKILYIDVDTIVLNDISKLYNTDISGYLLGATINAGTVPHAMNNWPIRGVKWKDYLDNTLHLKDYHNYFQAGVLLVNIPEITKFDLQNRALEQLKKINPVLVDQDILNVVCEGHVKKISLQWDFLDAFRPEWKTEDRIDMLPSDDREDYIKASKNPYILHYAGEWLRAWEFPEVRYSSLWWKFAKQSIFYETILFKNIQARYDRNHIGQIANKPQPVVTKNELPYKHLLWNTICYYRVKLLSKITFGKTRKHYKNKKKKLKMLLKNLKKN